jgi:hypothetical protein
MSKLSREVPPEEREKAEAAKRRANRTAWLIVAPVLVFIVVYVLVTEFHYFDAPSHEVPTAMRWMPWRWAEMAEKCATRPPPCPPGFTPSPR